MTNDASPKAAPDTMRYIDAMQELQKILSQLDGDDVDLDDLSDMVERAAALIRSCRARIVATEMRVNEIVADLQADFAGEGDE